MILAEPEKPLNYIAADYGMTVPDGQSTAEFLYDLCINASIYRALREIVVHPMTVPEITGKLKAMYPVTEQDMRLHIVGTPAITMLCQSAFQKSMLVAAWEKFVRLSELGSHFIDESRRSSSVMRLLDTM